MPRKTIAALTAVAALAGAGAGAAVYGVTAGGGGSTTVTTRIAAGAPVANASALTVNQIYKRTVPGIVEVDSTTSGS